jgi:peptide/nickel transport system substrate-binding protein
MNSVRYSSTQFDSAFVSAVREADPTKRNALYLRADQIAMNDAAVMPIYYEQNDRLVHRNVRNFDINAMEYRDMTAVWIDKGEGKKDSAK